MILFTGKKEKTGGNREIRISRRASPCPPAVEDCQLFAKISSFIDRSALRSTTCSSIHFVAPWGIIRGGRGHYSSRTHRSSRPPFIPPHLTSRVPGARNLLSIYYRILSSPARCRVRRSSPQSRLPLPASPLRAASSVVAAPSITSAPVVALVWR